MTSADDKVIVWKLNAAQPRWASVRYRCVLPMLNLREMGYRSLVLQGRETVRDFSAVRCVIFVKTFTHDDVALAKKAARHGVPVVVTGLPSLEPLEDCIIRDDLEAGIRTYLTDRARVASDLRKARFVLEETYSGPAVAHRLANLLESLLGSAAVASG